MDAFDLFLIQYDNSERIKNLLTLYALNKDIHTINEMFFPLSEEEEFIYFFEKYREGTNLYEIDIRDFPIEKLLIFCIEIYEKIRNDEIRINVEKLDFPFELDKKGMELEIKKTIKETYINAFLEEIKRDDLQDEFLLKYKNQIIVSQLEEKMYEYSKKEEYEKAAEIRDEIKKIKN